MKLEKRDEINVISYEIKDAKYIPGSEGNAAYWTGIDFSNLPPFPADIPMQGEIALWKHSVGELVELSYYFGFETDVTEAPDGFVNYKISPAEYAVFEATDKLGTEPVTDTAAQVRACVKKAMKEDIPAAGYAYDLDHGMCFEFYKGSQAFLYIPVRKA